MSNFTKEIDEILIVTKWERSTVKTRASNIRKIRLQKQLSKIFKKINNDQNS